MLACERARAVDGSSNYSSSSRASEAATVHTLDFNGLIAQPSFTQPQVNGVAYSDTGFAQDWQASTAPLRQSSPFSDSSGTQAGKKRKHHANYAKRVLARAVCDFDNFKLAAKVVMNLDEHVSPQRLTLADLWQTFERSSLFGLPVSTFGSSLGTSTAYFVPLLSAMRMFSVSKPSRPCHCIDALPAHAVLTCRHVDSASMQDAPHLLALYHNRKLPWERSPLYHDVQQHAEAEPCEAIPHPHALLDTLLADVHPSSWFAVWWQPLYRIPDMPLEAKFLAYYTFDGLAARLHNHGQRGAHLPVQGLLCSAVQTPAPGPGQHMHEDWLHAVPGDGGPWADNPAEAAALAQRAQERVHAELRKLHSTAQQLVCDCRSDVQLEGPNGRRREVEPHNDFAFLQRGRRANGMT